MGKQDPRAEGLPALKRYTCDGCGAPLAHTVAPTIVCEYCRSEHGNPRYGFNARVAAYPVAISTNAVFGAPMMSLTYAGEFVEMPQFHLRRD